MKCSTALLSTVTIALFVMIGLSKDKQGKSDPTKPINFTDDFVVDTRKEYKIIGKVSWEKNALTLEREASLQYSLRMGGSVDFTAHLQIPHLAPDENDVEAHIGFVLENGDAAIVAFRRYRESNQVKSELYFGESSLSTDSQLKIERLGVPVPLPASELKPVWLVKYRHGLIYVELDGKLVAREFLNLGGHPVTAVRLAGPSVCKGIRVTASLPPTAILGERVRDWQESFELEGQLLQLVNTGKFDTALEVAQRVLALRQKVASTDRVDFATAWYNLGFVRHARGELAEAAEALRSAHRAYQDLLGEDHPLAALALDKLGEVLLAQGEWPSARQVVERGLQIRQRLFGPEHPHVANSFTNLGAFLQFQGDLVGARDCFERALAIRRRWFGQEHEDTANSLNNLGQLLQALNDFAAARPLLVRALAIRQKSGNPIDAAVSQVNLGLLRRSTGEYTEAEKLMNEALETFARLLGEGHQYTLQTLQNLAAVHVSNGRFEDARSALEKALQIHRRTASPNVSTPLTLINLGVVRLLLGEHPGAYDCLQEAHETLAQLLGKEHEYTAQALANLAGLRMEDGDYHTARTELAEVLRARTCSAEIVVQGVSEAEANNYLKAAQFGRDPFLMCLRHLPGVTGAEAYGPIWRTRALATRVQLARRSLTTNDPVVHQLWEKLRSVRYQLARACRTIVPSDQAESRQTALAELTNRKEILERQLAARSTNFRLAFEAESAEFTALIERLPPNMAFIDIVRTRTWPESRGEELPVPKPSYDAFILRKNGRENQTYPIWVPLGPAAPIDKACRQFSTSLFAAGRAKSVAQIDGSLEAVPTPERTVRNLVWDKLEPNLKGCTRIVIAPDGDLTALPWAALPGRAAGSYLVDDYELTTISHGQLLLDLWAREPCRADNLLLVGGLDYEPKVDAEKTPTKVSERARLLTLWPPLPGTRDQVNRIAALGWEGVTRFSSRELTRDMLGQQLVRCGRAVLGTHGFAASYDSNYDEHPDAGRRRLMAEGLELVSVDTHVAQRNRLLLSGLILSDGEVFSGEEIVQLDLSGMELVVLSACNTASGEVEHGEGTYGLQRAFALAGARSVVATLGPVNDQAAGDFMVRFFTNVKKGCSPADSLRRAQLDLRNGRGDGDSSAPRHWAAWILSGDPGLISKPVADPLRERGDPVEPISEMRSYLFHIFAGTLIAGAFGFSVGWLLWVRRRGCRQL